MSNIEEILNKIFISRLEENEICYLNNKFQESEQYIIKLFSSLNINDIDNEIICLALDNVDLLQADVQYIIKYEFYKLIVKNYFYQKNKFDIFSLISNRKDFYNKIYFLIEDYSENKIIDFIKNMCQINNYSLIEEYLNCLTKICNVGSLKSGKIINLLDNHVKYDLHVRSMKDKKYLLLWFKFDSYLGEEACHSFYYNYLIDKISDDSDFCNNLENLSLSTISDSKIIKLLNKKQKECPRTIKKITKRCIEAKNPHLLLQFSSFLSEKELLGALFKIGDQAYIKSFLVDKKNTKDIKDLAIYY